MANRIIQDECARLAKSPTRQDMINGFCDFYAKNAGLFLHNNSNTAYFKSFAVEHLKSDAPAVLKKLGL